MTAAYYAFVRYKSATAKYKNASMMTTNKTTVTFYHSIYSASTSTPFSQLITSINDCAH